MINQLNHEQYGTIIYAREPELVTDEGGAIDDDGIHRSTIKFGDTKITNIYKPPNATWTTPPKENTEHPSLIIGDFNSHHTNWGYNKNNQAGVEVNDWSTNANLTLLYNPKDKGTFRSARWNKEYTPDLVFVSKNNNGNPLPATREILKAFPHSQHRPIKIKTGIQIPMLNTIPKPRWNFKKADWKSYAEEINKT